MTSYLEEIQLRPTCCSAGRAFSRTNVHSMHVPTICFIKLLTYSRLDYCNSILGGRTASSTRPTAPVLLADYATTGNGLKMASIAAYNL